MRITKESGITLIALTITIVLMLILLGVSVNVALKGGLFNTAKNATANARGQEVWKAVEECKTMIEMNGYDEEKAKKELDELLEDLLEQQQITQEEKQTVEEIGRVTIGDKTIIFEEQWIETEEGITNGRVTLQIGDYINYMPKSVTLTSESQLIKNLQEYSGYTGTSYNTESTISQQSLKWRVLDAKDGNLRLISEQPTTSTIYLSGYNGYNNAVYLIDEACNNLYSGSKGTAKNLKIEDIQDKLTYDYTKYTNTNTIKFGEIIEHTEKKYYPDIFAKEKTAWVDGVQGTELNLSEQTELIKQGTTTKQATTSIKAKLTNWIRSMNSTDFEKTIYYNLFISNDGSTNYNSYWISSRCTDPINAFITFCVFGISDGKVTRTHLGISGTSYAYKGERSLRPVVTLNSDVQVGKKIDGVWQLN